MLQQCGMQINLRNHFMNANNFNRSKNTKLWILKKCYEIFIAKYPVLLERYEGHWNENKISDELVLEAEKENLSLLGFELVREYSNLIERNRCDIRITTATDIGLNDRKIIIECKIIDKPSEYIDKKESNKKKSGKSGKTNGIMSFIRGKYAKKMKIAGMVGYNKTGDIQKRIKKIKKLVDERQEDGDMINIQNLEKCEIAQDFNHSYVSSHERDGDLPNIDIYHLFFDFTTTA